jgi:hypothetical protein
MPLLDAWGEFLRTPFGRSSSQKLFVQALGGSGGRRHILWVPPQGSDRVLQHLLREVGTRPDCWRLVSRFRSSEGNESEGGRALQDFGPSSCPYSPNQPNLHDPLLRQPRILAGRLRGQEVSGPKERNHRRKRRCVLHPPDSDSGSGGASDNGHRTRGQRLRVFRTAQGGPIVNAGQEEARASPQSRAGAANGPALPLAVFLMKS